MGLQLLGRAKEQLIDMPSEPEASLAQGQEKKMSILDLPSETQKDIFKYVSTACQQSRGLVQVRRLIIYGQSNTTDLIALSLVSKRFREIAAEQLYRTFHIVFPDDESPSDDFPIDGLASGLDTFVTSDYDYAKHLREIVLEPVSGGVKGERAYRQYRYDLSCGKFMNTLLLLTLRKAKALETFR